MVCSVCTLVCLKNQILYYCFYHIPSKLPAETISSFIVVVAYRGMYNKLVAILHHLQKAVSGWALVACIHYMCLAAHLVFLSRTVQITKY